MAHMNEFEVCPEGNEVWLVWSGRSRLGDYLHAARECVGDDKTPALVSR